MKNNLDVAVGLIKLSERSLKVARAIDGQEGLNNEICFNAQQSIEKSIKAAIACSGNDFPKSHNLVLLYDTLQLYKANIIKDYSEEAMETMSSYTVNIRYDFSYSASNSEASNAVEYADMIYHKCLSYVQQNTCNNQLSNNIDNDDSDISMKPFAS